MFDRFHETQTPFSELFPENFGDLSKYQQAVLRCLPPPRELGVSTADLCADVPHYLGERRSPRSDCYTRAAITQLANWGLAEHSILAGGRRLTFEGADFLPSSPLSKDSPHA